MLRVTPLLAATFFAGAAMADGIDGARFVVTNTFQGGQTGGSEVDVAKFGLTNSVFATVSGEVEIPGFITLYDIDVTADTIGFTWIETEFSKTITGPTPEGNHDRNYITLDLPEGVEITGIAFDAAASKLLEGSAEPTAAVLGPNRIVTDFSTGVVRGVGFNPVFKLTFK